MSFSQGSSFFLSVGLHLSGLEKHRGERDVLNLVAAGAACGGMFGAFGGPKKLLVSAATGSGLSLGYAFFLFGVSKIARLQDRNSTTFSCTCVFPVYLFFW